MQIDRQFQLRAARIERLQTVRVDPRIRAHGARQVHADQTETADGVLQYLHRDLFILQRNGGGSVKARREPALLRRHFLVPQNREIATLFDRKRGEENRKGADGAHDADLMTKRVHMGELRVDVVPFGAAVQHAIDVRAQARRIAAAVVGARIGKVAALAHGVEHRAGPPMKMRVDHPHGLNLPAQGLARRL